MKRLLTLSFAVALLLTGCGMKPEQLSAPATFVPVVEAESTAQPRDEEEIRTEALPSAEPVDFDSITDQEALECLYSGEENTSRIAGYMLPHEGDYTVFVAPDGSDPVQALQETEPNCQMTCLEEKALYALYSFPSLDECPRLIPLQLRMAGENYARYDGGFNEAEILACFDMLAHDQKILYRWYRDDPTIKCVSYEFIAVKEETPEKAVLGWYCYLIDRDDHLVSLTPEWNRMRDIELTPDPQPSQQQSPDITETVTDIELGLGKTEILIGQDDPKILVRAIPPAGFTPDNVQLIDADTGELVAKLVDDCDYAAHGDNIQGDGWYCNFFTPDTEFGTDPDVSEKRTYRLYAEFVENNTCHRSETVELLVMEPFTEAELDQMEQVRKALQEMTASAEWKQAGTEHRRVLAMELLYTLAEEGLVIQESIGSEGDVVSYSYACGVNGGIELMDLSRIR